jgi:hypothetical protein
MNIPRDLLLDSLEAPAAPDVSALARIAGAWRRAEARARRYIDLLGRADADVLIREALRRARLRLGTDAAAEPVRAALEELHALLAEQGGHTLTARPELDSVGARLADWSDEGTRLRSAPPIRLRHMAPEKHDSAARRDLRSADGAQGQPLRPTLARSK